MSDSPYDKIIMDTSHDYKNDDGHASAVRLDAVRLDVDSSVLS